MLDLTGRWGQGAKPKVEAGKELGSVSDGLTNESLVPTRGSACA